MMDERRTPWVEVQDVVRDPDYAPIELRHAIDDGVVVVYDPDARMTGWIQSDTAVSREAAR